MKDNNQTNDFRKGDYIIFKMQEDEHYPGYIKEIDYKKNKVIVEICTDIGMSKEYNLLDVEGKIRDLEKLEPKIKNKREKKSDIEEDIED